MNSRMSLPMAITIGVNAMVGAGIFAIPSILQVSAGPAGLLAYFFVIIAVIFMAFSFAYLSKLYPGEGSFYTYSRQWAGHTGGLITAFIYIIGLVVAMGLLTKITGTSLHLYIPTMSSKLLGLLALVSLIILNMAGAVLSQVGQVVLAILTFIPLILITLLCLSHGSLENLSPFAPYGYLNIIKAVKAVVFGFFGFEAIAALFLLMDNPERTVPKAIITSILLVGAVYITFVGSIFFAIPRGYFISAGMPLSQALINVFPDYPIIIHVINWGVIITIMGTLHAMIWAVSTLFVSISQKISFLKNLITTKRSVLFIGTSIALCSVLFDSVDLFFSIASVCIVSAYISAMLSLLLVSHRRTNRQIFFALGGILTAILICLSSLESIIRMVW